jgi:SAM-dependent methyltransferase
MPDPRLQSPAAQRNRDAILDVLRRVLPAAGTVLEIASGTGEHVAHFAAALPGLVFQPSDPAPERRASIDAWCAGLPNVLSAIDFDTTARNVTDITIDAIFCANMIHIAPWAAAEGLFSAANRLLFAGEKLVLYGPYRVNGADTSPGNAAFDADLRTRNPEWGIRDLEVVAKLAERSGFDAPEITQMPANNLALVFTRKA